MRKKIGIYGGYFNPVHNGHLKCANFAKEKLNLDEIWFIPSFESPLKNIKYYIHPIHRLKMIEAAIEEIPYLKTYDWEINRKQKSYTIDLVNHLHETFPDNNFVLLIGDDQTIQFNKWKNAKELVKKIPIYSFKRHGNFNIVKLAYIKKRFNIKSLKNDYFLESSSSFFKYFNQNDLPAKVHRYILLNNLYFYDFARLHLSPSRFSHSEQVMKIAVQLSYVHNLPVIPAYKAGILHDIAKEWTELKQRHYIEKYLPHETFKPKYLWHGIIGADVARRVLHISNNEVMDAIKSHTLPSIKATSLDKIMFCADSLANDRKFENREKLLNLCLDDIDTGFIEVLRNKYNYLLKTKKEIDDISLKVYESYLGVF
ncbi:nicotinate-nucleotide adenylyltransferase [Mycoplasma sp. (ex Biomphalaria glabrata)]|uniref:nicotinate-nucleotide adenylyltransferase n=1 Tax=Mycoplasma sp. (ex Biomphalaria glabrata) TaxID=1749074 RepID=UPI000AA52869|nr:nicotinate-nucleotide adenylyltransferase [Mycoplasma sp. (ex Biomphalaria glabrata)]